MVMITLRHAPTDELDESDDHDITITLTEGMYHLTTRTVSTRQSMYEKDEDPVHFTEHHGYRIVGDSNPSVFEEITDNGEEDYEGSGSGMHSTASLITIFAPHEFAIIEYDTCTDHKTIRCADVVQNNVLVPPALPIVSFPNTGDVNLRDIALVLNRLEDTAYRLLSDYFDFGCSGDLPVLDLSRRTKVGWISLRVREDHLSTLRTCPLDDLKISHDFAQQILLLDYFQVKPADWETLSRD